MDKDMSSVGLVIEIRPLYINMARQVNCCEESLDQIWTSCNLSIVALQARIKTDSWMAYYSTVVVSVLFRVQ